MHEPPASDDFLLRRESVANQNEDSVIWPRASITAGREDRGPGGRFLLRHQHSLRNLVRQQGLAVVSSALICRGTSACGLRIRISALWPPWTPSGRLHEERPWWLGRLRFKRAIPRSRLRRRRRCHHGGQDDGGGGAEATYSVSVDLSTAGGRSSRSRALWEDRWIRTRYEKLIPQAVADCCSSRSWRRRHRPGGFCYPWPGRTRLARRWLQPARCSTTCWRRSATTSRLVANDAGGARWRGQAV